MKRWTIRIGFLFLGISVICILTLHGMEGHFQASESDVLKCFKTCSYSLETKSLSCGSRELHYVEIGEAENPLLLFIPGSPGTWDNFMAYLADETLLKRIRMISVDRLGMGASRKGGFESSLAAQAEAFWPLLEKETQPVIVVGHSYGGAVASKLAMEYPEKLKGLVLVAASVSPDHEERRWYNHLADGPAISWMLPRSLVGVQSGNGAPPART